MDVLLVEDNNVVRNQLWELLLEEGFDVETARNGEEALQVLAENEQPRVVLTDLYMPVMSGFDLVKHMKLDSSLHDVPIVTMSSIQSTVPPKGTVFMKKPLNLELLVEVLKQMTGKEIVPLAANS